MSLELANFGILIFDKGFQSVRGDSSVAVNNAIAVVGECLAIVHLNLQSCFLDSWYESVRDQTRLIKEQYLRLLAESRDRLEQLEIEAEAEASYLLYKRMSEFRKGGLAKHLPNDFELEQLARRLQNALYINQDCIWKDSVPETIFEFLKPEVLLRNVLGYTCIKSNDLGFAQDGGGLFEVAGLIDRDKMLVQTKSTLAPKVANFTIAHELVHALLHDNIVMHRDRAVDGSSVTLRTQAEVQADKFAAYFLMPAKLVRAVFEELFQTSHFVISGQTALGLRVDLRNLNDH